ncbi:hypothetical protein [Yanghanlia caeni]|uniref:Uncharacterized protein n=1 Tax=Yanghanlia caeni TaxID=3064283 RepID=A0ABU1D4N6_9BURK|nr:hypothetical protein [Alcaligenaceae bacterium LG-2]
MDVQWDALFRFEVAPLELFIRGSLMYCSFSLRCASPGAAIWAPWA